MTRFDKTILEKALSHKYVLPKMEFILNPKVLRFGNRSLDNFPKNSFPFSFISMKKESAVFNYITQLPGRVHS